MSKIDKNNPGRTFEVVYGQVGAWPQGHAFSEYEFRRIHPAPPKPANPDEDPVDPEDYYHDVLTRLLTPDGNRPAVIRHVADRKADVTPLGPEANAPKPFVNPIVAEVTRTMQEQQALHQASATPGPAAAGAPAVAKK